MSESVAQTQTRLSEFIVENFPTADVSPGSALSELVVKLAATLQNEIYNDITALGQSGSVQTALASTVDTYNPIIDEIASNYNVSRFAGTYSTGNIKLTLSKNQDLTIPSGSQFVQGNLGLTYATTLNYSYSTNNNAINGKLPIYTQAGLYYVIVPVQATSVGSQYQVSDQTQFTLGTNYTNVNVVTATAYGNFSSGLPEDTDKQLINKFQVGLTNKSLTSQSAISNYLSSNFPTFRAVSVIGANDEEMIRSKQNVFGTSTFGMADVYVRTSVGPSTLTVTLPGTKTSQGIWTIDIPNSACPGFYSIKGILPTPINNTVNSAGTLVINSTTLGYSNISGYSNNQIPTVADATFTAYQTGTVILQYVESPNLSVGANLNFDITFYYQPNILDIQETFLNDSTRLACADYLVKAAVPCQCSVTLTLARLNPTDTAASIGVPSLQADIFNYINSLNFNSTLAASELVKICHTYPIERVVLPISMTGTILTINGTTRVITSSDELVIPVDIDNGISPNTTCFFIDYFTAPLGDVIPSNNIIINLV